MGVNAKVRHTRSEVRRRRQKRSEPRARRIHVRQLRAGIGVIVPFLHIELLIYASHHIITCECQNKSSFLLKLRMNKWEF